MAFPTASVIEQFTGDDDTSPPNANWTNDPFGFGSLGVKISSNQAAALSGAGPDAAYWNAATFGPDCEACVTLAADVAADAKTVMVLARLTTPGLGTLDGYAVTYKRYDAEGDKMGIARLDDSSPTYLGSLIPQDVEAGDAIGISVVGSTITAYHKPAGGSWSEVGSRTDATYSAAGYAGVAIGDSTARLDDFAAGTIGGAGGPTFPGGKMLRGVGGA